MTPCVYLLYSGGRRQRTSATPAPSCAACNDDEEPKQRAGEGRVQARRCGGVPRGTAGHAGAAGRLRMYSDLLRSAPDEGTTETTRCRQPNCRTWLPMQTTSTGGRHHEDLPIGD